jgi:predicted peptidase
LALAVIAVFAVEIRHEPMRRFHFEKRVESEVPYLLQVPKGYKADPAKRWPLVVFLHGSGERGNDLQTLSRCGPPKRVAAGREFPFVLLSPQCPENQHWQNDVLLALLDQVVATEMIDTNRIYLTGLSMGGYGTWYLGLKHPERFAALAPVCGGGQVLDVVFADQRAAELTRMPVWAFHGAMDTVVPPSESEQMVGALRRIGNPMVRHTVCPDAGHDSWTATYDDPAFYEWLLSQTRENRFATR